MYFCQLSRTSGMVSSTSSGFLCVAREPVSEKYFMANHELTDWSPAICLAGRCKGHISIGITSPFQPLSPKESCGPHQAVHLRCEQSREPIWRATHALACQSVRVAPNRYHRIRYGCGEFAPEPDCPVSYELPAGPLPAGFDFAPELQQSQCRSIFLRLSPAA